MAIDLKDAYFRLNPSKAQAVSSVCLRRAGISIQGSSLWGCPCLLASHFQPLEGYLDSTGMSALRTGVPMHHYNRRFQDNGSAASRVWTGPQLHWHINCLELLAVLLALRRFQPLIQGKHMLVWTDNTATTA